MPIRAATGYSRRQDAFQAGRDAAEMALRQGDAPDFVILCASVVHDQERVLEGVRSVTERAVVFGGSSFGEMTERGLNDGSVSLMALTLQDVELSVGLGADTDRDPFRAGSAAAREAYLGLSRHDAPGKLGLLIAEMTANEEPLLGIQDTLDATFPLFGGCCSGDRRAPIVDPAFSEGYQYLGDRAHRHAALLALLSGDFVVSFGVAHGWQPLGIEVEVGATDGSIVREIGGEPALAFYARYLGDGQPTAFPLGLVKDGHLILRAARGVAPGGGIAFTAPLPRGCKVRLTRGSRADILRSTEEATQRALETLGRDRVRAAIVVSCISRRTMLGTRVDQELDAVRRVLGDAVPLVGFYAAGEYAPPAQQSVYHNCTFCLCLLGDRESVGRQAEQTDSHAPLLTPTPEGRTLRSALSFDKSEEQRRRVLVLAEQEHFASECKSLLHDLVDSWEWQRDWPGARRSLETEYAQVVVLEQKDAGLIGEMEALSSVVQVVVVLDGKDRDRAEEISSQLRGTHAAFAGCCGRPLSRGEARLLVDRALETSLLRVQRRLLERQLQQAQAGLQNAENAVETSEKMLTETYRAIEKANRDMRIVLDNVQQGFVTLDRAGVMAHGRSRAVDDLLGDWSGPVEFSTYLSRCSPALGQLFALAFEQVVDGILPLEVTLDLLPRQWVVGPRHLRFEYVPVLPRNGDPERIEGMVVVVTDATAEVKKREAEAEQQEALEVFKRILRDPDAVVQFANDASRMVRRLTEPSEEHAQDPAAVRRLLHTLKGNCGIMGLHRVAALCHGLEDGLAAGDRNELDHEQRTRLAHTWQSVAKLVESFLSQRRDEIPIPRDVIRILSEKAERGLPASQLSAEIRTLLFESARRRLERLAESARAIAQRLERGSVEVQVQADDVRLEPQKWAPLWSELVHLVRNAVDHGVEHPARRPAHKPPPLIVLAARREGACFVVEVTDNGPGIDWERVASKAAELGLPTANLEDLTAALFADRLSTRTQTTDTSGRGVGLAALRRVVDQLGGKIEVISRRDEGTTFTLRFEIG